MDILANISNAAACSAVSFLIYKTDFIAEYGKLIGLSKPLRLSEYFCHKILSGGKASYFDFLKSKYDNFIARLLSCPFCLGFWLCLIASKFKIDVLTCYFFYVLFYKIINK
jgi:hypothetical protein